MKALQTFTLFSLGLFSLCFKKKKKISANADSAKSSAAPLQHLSIGYQKSALNLLVARQQKLFEQQLPNVKVDWKEFPAGPQMLEALAVGAVDFGYVGNTPPIFAQAAGKDIRYVGYEVVTPNSQALVVPSGSPIQSLQDLKGKRIAVQKGSSAHELLGKVLKQAQLSWKDIQPIWLAPAEARAAFDKNSIDAWVIWDPFLSAAKLDAQAQVLIDGTAFPKSYAFYIGNPKFIQQHPHAVSKVLASLNAADQWILQHQDQALSIYTQSTGLAPHIATPVFQQRLKPSPIYPLNNQVIQSQQHIANSFQQDQLIPQSIKIQSVVLKDQHSITP